MLGFKGRRRAFAAAVLALGLASGLTACGSDDDDGGATAAQSATTSQAPAKATSISIATVPCLCFAPVELAKAERYLAQEKVTLKPTQIPAGQDALTFVAAGRVDAALIGVSAGFFNAIGRGANVKLVASMGGESDAPDATPAAPLLVRKALVQSGQVKSVADLKGRKVALFGGAGSLPSFDMSVYLGQKGMTLDDIKVVNLGFPETVQALKTGGVDASVMGAPFSMEAVQKGYAEVFGDSVAHTLDRSLTKVGLFVNPQYLEKNRDAVNRMVTALVKTTPQLQGDAFFEPKTQKILMKATGLNAEGLKRGRFYFDPHLDPKNVALSTLQDIYIKQGTVAKPADLSQVVDDGPTQYAAQHAG
jgi:NitT/TauT family transport system substrate-binding protein